jgi:hypothetical protein
MKGKQITNLQVVRCGFEAGWLDEMVEEVNLLLDDLDVDDPFPPASPAIEGVSPIP